MDINLKRKIMMICGMCYEITTTTKAHVFFDYIAHTNCVEIRGYANGWKYGDFTNYRVSIYDFTDEQLDNIIKNLQAFWEEVKSSERRRSESTD